MNRFLHAWRTLNLPCEAISELVSRSIDQDLPTLERWTVRSHLLYCVACRRLRKQLRLMRQVLKDAPSHADALGNTAKMPPELRDKLRRITNPPA